MQGRLSQGGLRKQKDGHDGAAARGGAGATRHQRNAAVCCRELPEPIIQYLACAHSASSASSHTSRMQRML